MGGQTHEPVQTATPEVVDAANTTENTVENPTTDAPQAETTTETVADASPEGNAPEQEG